MANQSAANVLVAVRRESAIGVQATATGAQQLRITDSPGLELKRGIAQSNEKRTDALTTPGRLASKEVNGSYNAELTVGGAIDLLMESMMRGVWATATSIPFLSMTTVAIGSNTLTAGSGDWIGGAGLRVGDVFTVTGTSVGADNNTRAQIVALTTLTITTATGAFTTLTATATGTLTRLKKLINPAAPTKYAHSIEQYDADIDFSELFIGCRLVGMKISFRPNTLATIAFTFMGLDRQQITSVSAPYFTTPAVTTGLALVPDDSAIRYNGNAVAILTGFDLDFTIKAKVEQTIGGVVSPDVFDNDLDVSATVMGLRQDFSNLTLFDAETEFDVSILLQEPNSGPPKNCFGFYLPRVKIAALNAPVGGGDGAKVETKQLIVGPKVAATGYDATTVVICSSAP